MVRDSADKTQISNTPILWLCKAFANNSSATENYQKYQLHKKGQSRRFSGRLLRPLLKINFPLIKNLLKPLAKSFLIALWLRVAGLAIDAAIQRELFGSSMTIINNFKWRNGWYYENS